MATTKDTSPEQATALVPVADMNYEVMRMDPAEIRELVRESIGDQTISAMDLERVKIPSGGMIAWELPSIGEPEIAKSFTGVIIAQRAGVRTYWSKGLDEGSGSTPPDCFCNGNGVGIGSPGGACATCPFNVFGSAKHGEGRGKACKESTMVFILRDDSILPTLLLLPPTSMKAMKQYCLRLMSKRTSPIRVLTEFTLEKSSNADNITYAKLVCKPVGALSDDAAARIKAYAEQMAPLFAAVDVVDAMATDDAVRGDDN